MKKSIIFCVTLLVIQSAVLATTQEDCLTMFEDGGYTNVVNQCDEYKKVSQDLGFAVLASQLFSQISKEQLNQVFYSGIDTGIGGYFSENDEALYTNLQKYYIREYFSEMAEYAEKGHAMARELTAKMYYIDSQVLSESGRMDIDGQKVKDFQKYYIENLEYLLKEKPNDIDILFLLGQQGVKIQTVMHDWRTVYYQITDQKYYGYLKKAYEMGDPRAYFIHQGVERWNKHVGNLESLAAGKDKDALRELGYSLMHDGASPSEYE
ncbi:hypothetical protein [Marinicella sp. W31]|uniref:hypothetical protein n=1 Tax=Marinicella sp. W31 TaxID=3023713 RepID=UPI0037572AD8